MGSGFSVIEGALLGQLSFGLLFALIFLKPLATSLTLGSGNSGGVFAPSLFAGAARAPFTAILIVFEMTDDYRLIVPLMASVITSLIVAERLHRESIYTLKLTRRGIHFRRGRDVDVMEAVHVEEVMVAQPVTVPVNLPVALLADEFLRTGRHGFPVLNEDSSLFGMVSLSDHRRAMMAGNGSSNKLLVRDIATQDIVTIFPDETVGTALRRMAPRDLSRLPVVSRENPRRLLGVVCRNDIVRAYEVGAIRREEARRRAEAMPALHDTRAEFVDVPLSPHARSVGKTVAELGLPREVVLVSIRRGRELIIPHGDTRLQAGDIVTALCEHEHVHQFKAILTTTS